MLRHLSFANICSALALTIALGSGTAYAANTIRSKDIVNGQVKAPDLAKNSVRTASIKNGQVGLADLMAGSVSGSKVVDGSLTVPPLAQVTSLRTASGGGQHSRMVAPAGAAEKS